MKSWTQRVNEMATILSGFRLAIRNLPLSQEDRAVLERLELEYRLAPIEPPRAAPPDGKAAKARRAKRASLRQVRNENLAKSKAAGVPAAAVASPSVKPSERAASVKRAKSMRRTKVQGGAVNPR